MRRSFRAGAPVSLAFALVACGGGGGGSAGGAGNPPMPAPTDYNLQAGMKTLIANGLSANVSLSATQVGNGTTTQLTGTGTYKLSAATSTTVDGMAASEQTESLAGTLMTGGQSAPTSLGTTWDYTPSDGALISENLTSNSSDIAQPPIEWPTAIVAGSGGDLGTITVYTDSTRSTPAGSIKVSYSTTAPADPGGPLAITLTSKFYDANNTQQGAYTRNITLTTGNVIAFVSFSIQDATGNLVKATAQ